MKKLIKCPNCGQVQAAEAGMVHCKKCNFHFNVDSQQPLKALSIQQPWAWAITMLNVDPKDIENRDWPTTFTGPVLVHSGKKFDKEGYNFLVDKFKKEGKLDELPAENEFKKWMGGIVGIVDITGCVDKSDSTWFFGPFGFTLENAKVIDLIPCNGQLKFFTPKLD